jgi:putative FmdB family regulatory protein
MPLFEFRCQRCEAEVERLMKHSDPPPKCERCDDRPMDKQVSRWSFVLKGGSWASTGYA